MEKTRILIVEDERLIAENNAILLRSLGYEVTEIASSAEKALASIERERPDVILLDIMLSGDVDGIEFAEKLREDHDIPFVYATAYADDHILERAKITTPYGYVLKPFTERDLHSNIEMALYKHRTENKINYLNSVLYALNQVNQLIVREKDPHTLLDQICSKLIQSRTFELAWVALLGDENTVSYSSSHMTGEYDGETELQPLDESGNLTDCAVTILQADESYILIESPAEFDDSKFSRRYSSRAMLGAKLISGEETVGLILVILDPSLARNVEIVELFQEVAMDIGFALHSLKMEARAESSQRQLVKSEEQYRLLAETAPDLILLHDLEGHISYVNEAGSLLSGHESMDLLDMKIQELTPQEHHSRLLEVSERSTATPSVPHSFEIELIARTGEEIPLEIISTLVKEQGKPSAFLIIGRDIRERREAETELRKLSRAIEQSPAAVVITDEDGKISYVNPKFTEMTGYTSQEVVNKYPTILRDPEAPQEAYQELLEDLRGGHEWHGELLSRKSNGEEFWANASITALRDSSGKTTHFVGIIEDVTQQKLIENRIRVAQESYEDIFNSTSDAIYILAQDGRFVDVNHGAGEMYGHPRQYFVGKTLSDLAAPEKNDLAAIKQTIEKAFTGEPQRFEFWGIKESGEIFPKDVQLNRGQYFGQNVVLATARDMSQRLQIENDLKAAVQQAQESEKVKSLFLANMSHEIRTPLTSIIGYIDLIYSQLEKVVGDDEKEYFEVVRRNSDRLTRTVHGVLDLSQIEAGAISIKPRVLDLNESIRALLQDLEPSATNKDLEIRFEPYPGECFIRADAESLNSALSNIIENAIIYTSQGHVEVRVIENNNVLTVIIHDTGIGISAEYLDNLWDAFSQESTGYTKDFQGLGLGLTIAKRCLDLNDIDVSVESSKGKGTTFTLSFPRIAESATTKEGTAVIEEPAVKKKVEPASRIDGSKHSVLIVEDDPNARKLFGLFLRDNYHIHFASSVQQGKDVMEKEQIDLVMTDLSLVGDEDGLVLVRYIRAQDRWTDIPVIALTAHAFVSDRDRCLEAGCDAFLTKPIFKKNLQETISEYLGA